jgi:hypothetical protein
MAHLRTHALSSAALCLILGFASSALSQAPAKEKEAALPTVAKSEAKGLRVFTCGHSFHVWVVPMLTELAKHAGIVDHQVAGVSSIGGSTVLKHWDVADEKNMAKKALNEGKVDVLTLSPIWLPDAGIENFATLAVKGNPNIRVTVQEYWLPNDEYAPVYPLEVRKKVGMDRNATSLPDLRKAQEKYDADIEAHVRDLNKKLGKDAILIVPVGRAVVAFREKIAAGQVPGVTTQAELFRDTWGHPKELIQVISAYCHFAVIYQRSPIGLPKPSIMKKPLMDDNLNRLLQELAWDAVSKHPMSGVKQS